MHTFISRTELRELSHVRPWRSAAQIAFEYSAIAAVAVFVEFNWNPILYLLGLIWIGSRQHAIGVLVHDAVHGTLFRKRRHNDLVGEILFWTLLSDYRAYRESHLAHHRFLNTDKDPDTGDYSDLPQKMVPMKRSKLLWNLFKYMTGLFLLAAPLIVARRIVDALRPGASPYKRVRMLVGFVVIAACIASPLFLRLYLLYWMVPLLTWCLTLIQARGVVDHHGLVSNDPLAQSRTVYTSFAGKLFLAPSNVGYHQAHHLYPSVPWHNLETLEHKLLEHPQYECKTVRVNGYFRFLREFLAEWSVREDNDKVPKSLAG